MPRPAWLGVGCTELAPQSYPQILCIAWCDWVALRLRGVAKIRNADIFEFFPEVLMKVCVFLLAKQGV
jgi:hypothetical protein